MRWVEVPPEVARRGDVADHKSGNLDPRAVYDVDHKAGTVRLLLLSSPSSPLPISNYTYTRAVNR